jgi:hypothetical protein
MEARHVPLRRSIGATDYAKMPSGIMKNRDCGRNANENLR